MKQKKLFLVLFLFIQLFVIGQTFEVDNLKYTVTSGTNVSVSKSNSGCLTGALTIPASVSNNGTSYLVNSIGNYAFYGCSNLTSVSIPDSVTSIGVQAFYDCSSLTSVSIPNSVTSIFSYAFSYCSSLASVSIPNSVIHIGPNAFRNCSSLTSVSIGNSVTTIGNSTFNSCTSLTSVMIPDSVTSIGESAFQSCTSLTSVSIPNSVTSIVFSAFLNCTSLTSVTCEIENPLTINANVFQNAPQSNATLYVPSVSVAAYQATPVWQDFGTILPIVTEIFPNVGIVGTITGWGSSPDIAMTTTDGVNYTASNISIPAGGGLVKFRQDSSWDINWGNEQFPTGTANLNGLNIPVPAGSYDVTFNIQTGVYNFTLLPSIYPIIGLIGEFNNWSESVNMYTTDGEVYVLNDFFIPAPGNDPGVKFRQNNSWDVNWGGASFPSGSATLSGGNIPASEGFYNVSFNLNTLEYIFEPVIIAIIGTADVDFNTDTALQTTNGIIHTLSAKQLSNGFLKFRKIGSWDLNWGGNNFPSGEATFGGVNIPVNAGNYNISFNRITGAYNFELIPCLSPTAEPVFYFTNGQTLADISVTGTNLTWYDAMTSGNVLASNTMLVDGTTYYVSQTFNGCESTRIAISSVLVPRTKLTPAFCGVSLSNININMQLTPVSFALGYKIYVKNMTTGITQTVTRMGNNAGARRVRISDFSNAAFETNFKVWAEITMDGSNFIEVLETDPEVCEVTTPALPIVVPNLAPASCGITVPRLNADIYTPWVNDNAIYCFHVSVNGEFLEEKEMPTRRFRLTDLTVAPEMGVTYTLKVRIKLFNSYSEYGTSCDIFTPSVPLTQLSNATCNSNIAGFGTTLRAAWVNNQVNAFMFAIVDAEMNIISEVERATEDVKLTMFPDFTPQLGTTYLIRVKVRIGNTWGAYGNVCSVTTLGGNQVVQRNTETVLDSEISVYPNPFSDSFTIKLSNDTKAFIQVFEVNGRLISSKNIENATEVTLGDNLAQGVYFVVVEQNGTIHTFKMVKK